jgi:alanine dehydrogenase
MRIAGLGWKQALKSDPHLRNGLNVADGKITCKPVADALDLDYVSADTILDL